MTRSAVAAFAAFALTLVPTHPLHAQTERREPAVLGLPAGTRAMGLGHAFQTGAQDSDAVFHNPALAGRAAGFALGVMVFGNAGRAFTASAGTSWLGGGVAAGLQAAEYGGVRGPGLRDGGLDPLFDDGPPGASELVATVAYAREILGFRVGVGGKLVDQRFGGARTQNAAADVGLARSLGPGWASLSVRNLGEAGELGGRELELPTEVTLGWGGYGEQVGPVDLGLAAAVTHQDDGTIVVGGGLEIGYWPIQGRTFVFRVGGRTVPEGDASPLTLGGSFWGDTVVLDYAFQPVEGTDGVHRVTLAWR